MKPVIAIVGRPNVGKSTLFNRIVGRRKAIVNDTAGVTRDRHYADADWDGKQFLLIDTGGLAEGDEKSIQNFIKKQTFAAIDEADAVIAIFDGREGPAHLDVEIMDLLRRSGKPIVYTINKLDKMCGTQEAESLVNQFYEFGIKDELYQISSEHGIGVDDVLDILLKKISEMGGGKPTDDTEPSNSTKLRKGELVSGDIRVAIIGRPNVGKSTLVNKIFGAERVIAHDMPGTTRDTIDVEVEFKGKKYIFVDTAGIKKKGKTIETLDKYSAIKTLDAINRANIALLLVDSNEGITHQDRALFDHAYSAGKGMAVLFNKWDDLKTDPNILEKFYIEKMKQLNKAPYLCISAKTGRGIDKIFPEIDRLAGALHYKFTTSLLNDLLEEFKEEHNIPSHNGRPVKLNYATQVKTTPPTFVIFTNSPEGVKDSYKKFLINKLQNIIGNGVPIRIKFRRK